MLPFSFYTWKAVTVSQGTTRRVKDPQLFLVKLKLHENSMTLCNVSCTYTTYAHTAGPIRRRQCLATCLHFFYVKV